MDRWGSLPIVCRGGLDLADDTLTLGTTKPGAATVLQNYEPAVAGGYSRIEGYIKWDSATVPGDATTPILGVGVGLGGVFAGRFATGAASNDIYFSGGAGWTKINTAARPGVVSKIRILPYVFATDSVYITDGVNPAAKWDGTTYTVINGVGAPTNPKYSEFFNNTIVLAGYGIGNKFTVGAPNSDTDFNGASGAVEFNLGDTVMGIKRFRDVLYIFGTNSIAALSGTSSADYVLAYITRSLGCLGQDTIQEVGGDLIYLAPDGFRSLAATYRIGDLQLGLLSRPIQPLLLSTDFTSGNMNDSYSAVHIAQKNQYRCFVYQSAVPKTLAFGVVGKRLDDPVNVTYEWGTLQGIQPYCAHSSYANNQEVSVIGDPVNGYVYRLESGNDFDGTPIYYIYRTPDLTFNDATLRKVMQKITLYTQIQGDFNALFNVQLDVQSPTSLQPPTLPLSAVGTLPLYGTAIYGTDRYGIIGYPVFKFPIVGAGFLVAFQFSGTDSNAPHRIDSFQIEFGEKGRR